MKLEHEVTHDSLERDAQRLAKASDDGKRAARAAEAQAQRARADAEAAARLAASMRGRLR